MITPCTLMHLVNETWMICLHILCDRDCKWGGSSMIPAFTHAFGECPSPGMTITFALFLPSTSLPRSEKANGDGVVFASTILS